MSQPYNIVHRLNNIVIDNPVERSETSIQVDFKDTIQGNVETDTYTFVNEAYTIIKNEFDAGLSGGNGVFEGIPYSIEIQKAQESESVFQGFLDMKSIEFLQPNEPKILSRVIKEDGLNNISERLQGLTFALLEANGTITNSSYEDVQTIIEKKVTFLEQALLALAIYLMVKEIIESIRSIAETVATIASITSSSTTGALGALVYAIASLLFQAAYTALMIVALFDLVTQFVNNLIPPTKKLKGIRFRTALNAIFSYLGYQLISPIKDLDNYIYMPSKADGRQNKGIPFASDYGFIANEFVDLCIKMFKAQLFVTDGVVQLRTESDPFFIKTSTYILPDVLERPSKTNANELKESVLISFRDDLSDEYTIDNWKGTSYVVTTKPNTFTNEKAVQITGLNEVRIPLSLGNRKDKLSSLENALNAFFETANKLFGVFGSNNTFPLLTERIGLLKVSSEFFNNAKVLKVKNGKLTSDYRTSLSAKYLYNNYINYDSFVQNNYSRQRLVYESISIPFSYSDYKKVLDNSYFTTSEGKTGRITSLTWFVETDKAEIDYYIEEVYTRNLREEFYEVD